MKKKKTVRIPIHFCLTIKRIDKYAHDSNTDDKSFSFVLSQFDEHSTIFLRHKQKTQNNLLFKQN